MRFLTHQTAQGEQHAGGAASPLLLGVQAHPIARHHRVVIGAKNVLQANEPFHRPLPGLSGDVAEELEDIPQLLGADAHGVQIFGVRRLMHRLAALQQPAQGSLQSVLADDADRCACRNRRAPPRATEREALQTEKQVPVSRRLECGQHLRSPGLPLTPQVRLKRLEKSALPGRGRGGRSGNPFELNVEVAHGAEATPEPAQFLFQRATAARRQPVAEGAQSGAQAAAGHTHVVQCLGILAKTGPGIVGAQRPQVPSDNLAPGDLQRLGRGDGRFALQRRIEVVEQPQPAAELRLRRRPQVERLAQHLCQALHVIAIAVDELDFQLQVPVRNAGPMRML